MLSLKNALDLVWANKVKFKMLWKSQARPRFIDNVVNTWSISIGWENIFLICECTLTHQAIV